MWKKLIRLLPFWPFVIFTNSSPTLFWTSLVAWMVKHLPTMQETRVQSLGQEDLLEREMASHSSILAWKIPWTEQPGRLYSMGSQRVRHDQATSLSFFSFSYFILVCFPWSLFPNPFSLLVTHYNIIHVLSVYASPEILCVTQYTWVKLHYKYQHRSFFTFNAIL